MPSSIFITPSFIIVELGFFFCSAAAAYELFIGDFIWAREEEERRRSAAQNDRGRGVSQRPYQSSQRQFHRSLSPGRGGRGRVTGHEPHDDERTSLLQGRKYTRRLNDSEEGSFPSPGDLRSVDVGRGVRGGSAGDSTRRLFYKLILLSLLARLLLIPSEFYCFGRLQEENSVALRILLRTSQTLPHIAFASSLGLLVIFCAKVAFAAMPPLSPNLSDESDEDEIVPAQEVMARDSIDEENEVSPSVRRKTQETKPSVNTNAKSTIYTTVSRVLRTILASKQTFSLWNFVILTSYSTIFVVISTKNGISVSLSEIYLWILLTAIYSLLFIALLYVAALLLKALRPGLRRRNDSNALALRLLGTCTLLGCIFIERIIRFAIAAHTASVYMDTDSHGERKLYSYQRDALDYGVSELIPVVCLLFMMHRRRRGEMPNDVLIMHSFINNVFGSMGVLSASEEEPADADAASAEGAIGSRRFQSYGGSKNDSFPPGSGRTGGGGLGIGRVASSSGPPLHPRREVHLNA